MHPITPIGRPASLAARHYISRLCLQANVNVRPWIQRECERAVPALVALSPKNPTHCVELIRYESRSQGCRPRMEGQSHAECFLPRSAFGALQRLRDSGCLMRRVSSLRETSTSAHALVSTHDASMLSLAFKSLRFVRRVGFLARRFYNEKRNLRVFTASGGRCLIGLALG